MKINESFFSIIFVPFVRLGTSQILPYTDNKFDFAPRKIAYKAKSERNGYMNTNYTVHIVFHVTY